jgi:hypothetical protein
METLYETNGRDDTKHITMRASQKLHEDLQT